ncbi:androglobin isoform X3 [Nematostella vectensis]|uniref:androglobin isoform X3 n=1 Tax=Nematostella vectensis TaxID=45351 RepID=UPI002076ECF9|nr:androglobin isoform X3 [Nematostella vectensis]
MDTLLAGLIKQRNTPSPSPGLFRAKMRSRLSQLKTQGKLSEDERPQSIAPSVIGSLKDGDDKKGKNKQPIIIWPEWSDQDINQEKWDTTHKAKEKEKGKSPNPHPYEDPEGRIDLPQSLRYRVDHWKRPVDFILEKVPVVVDPKSLTQEIDLLCNNGHLADCETLRWIIAQVTCLWKMHFKIEIPEVKTKDTKEGKEKDKDKEKEKEKEKQSEASQEDNTWKPWSHIWPKEKSQEKVKEKATAIPVYNPGGKYCVKVYWMGAWRKVTVDDWMPFDEEGKMLLPASPNEHELWPMFLSKALIKVASLDYAGGSTSCEIGDFTVVHALTGWLPEVIPLKYGHTSEVWDLLMKALPRWKLENTPAPDEAKPQAAEGGKKEREKDRKSTRSIKDRQKEESERESKTREKDKDKAGSVTGQVEQANKEPEFVIFASYSHPPTAPMRISVLREMADASEKLRQSGLSHNHPHPVMVTMIRDTPLVAPPPPIEIPRWKLIRQKKKKQPIEPPITPPEPPRDPKFLEVTSPFVNYNVSPIPVSRARTPVRWKKFRPERPMGEIEEESDKDEKKPEVEGPEAAQDGEKKEGNESAAEVEEVKPEPEKEPVLKERESRESLRERSGTKDCKSPKDRVKSAKSDRGDKEKQGKADKGDKSADRTKPGSKLNVTADKPERTKSGGLTPKSSGRRVSRMEKPGDIKSPPGRKVSRMEKPSKVDMEKDSFHEVEIIVEGEESNMQDAPNPTNDGETKSPGDAPEMEKGEEKTNGEKDEEGDKGKEEKGNNKKLWMDYEDFCKCFGSLYIFHKPNTYKFTKATIELKNIAITTHGSSKKSGLAPASSVTATTPAPGKATVLSPSPYYGAGGGAQSQEPPPLFLFVDSLQPVEAVVSFTAFSKWLDPPQPIIREKDKEKEKDSSSSITDLKEATSEEKPAPPTPGTLVAEPYSWKSLVTGQPVLRIRTTGTKAAVLCLPAGRHVLRFLLQAPHGFHVELCSQTPFVYGDEDTVMACLTKESCRFMEHAMHVMKSVGDLVTKFSDPPADKRPELDLGLKDESRDVQERHYKVFIRCLFKALKYNLGDAYDPAMHFAWKAFAFQASLCVRQHIAFRPLSAADITRIGTMRRDSPMKRPTSVPSSSQEKPSQHEEVAALKIQSSFRGHFVRKLAKAFVAGSDEQQQVSALLSKAWSTLEPNQENFAIEIFRRMFKRDQELFPLFPFFKDEWSRVAFTDYNGSYPEQPSNSWFVVFREVFMVDEPVLMVPKLYCNIPTCLLRVVDNDTGEELTRVFQRVAPNNMKKNKRGYTFIAEARILNAILPPGKFRLRVIGSTEPLPYPPRESVNSHFVHKEIRDYYIPNRYNIIFRHTVKVTDDHMASLQLGTSKPDVYIKLQILDDEVEVMSTTGKGHAVIPAFIFYRDRTGDEDEVQSKRGSRPPTSSRPRSGKRPPSGGRKAASSAATRAGKKSGKESSNSSRPESSQPKGSRSYLDDEDKEEEVEVEDTEPEIKIHKYIIQAQVLRDSWPLSRSAWDFVQMMKGLDKTDMEGAPTESAPRTDKLSTVASSKGKKGKESKEGRTSKGQSGSRPSSQQQFDSSKPNWTLRVFSDSSAEEIEIKKDTERQDEIKAMKQAWEAAEPGRAAKAHQSRQKFLSEHMVKLDKDVVEEEEEVTVPEDKEVPSEIFTAPSPVQSEAEGDLTLAPPSKEPDQVLRPLDPPKIIRSRGGNPVLMDETEEERRQLLRQEVFRAFKARRDEVEARREQDRLERNATKEKQLLTAEEIQAALDKARHEVTAAREQYRQKFLDADKSKEEQAEADKKDRSPSPGRSKSRKSVSTAKGGRKTPSKGKKK